MKKFLFLIFIVFISNLLVSAQSAKDLEGTWMGYYDCGQGRTGVRLIINEVSNNKFSGYFQFFPHYSNYSKNVGIGVTKISGEFYSSDNVKIDLTEWIYNPYNYMLVNIQASMDGTSSINGTMLDSSCGDFEVEKQ